MDKVASLQIRNFKAIESLDVPLGDVTLLIGANNSGKSSVLQAIHLAVSLAQSAALLGGVTWQQDEYELSFSQGLLLYCPVSDAMSLGRNGQLSPNAEECTEFRFNRSDSKSATVTLRKGRNRNLMVKVRGRDLGIELQDLTSPYSIFAPGLAGIARTENLQAMGLIRRIVARGDANLALRNVLYQLNKDRAKWGEFLADMNELFPDFVLQIDYSPDEDEFIDVKASYGGGPLIPLDAAGTSVLQASQLLSYVSLFAPRILVLDEPDSHLHPDKQRVLCEIIRRIAANRGIQIVMSTHSRHMLDSLRRTATVHWMSSGKIVAGTDLNVMSILMELGALDSVDFFTGGEVNCIVATEDSDHRYLKTMLESAGFDMERTLVRSYPGCSQVEAAVVLGSFLKEKAPNTKFIVHRDRDYAPDESFNSLRTRLEAIGGKLFLPPGNDIECSFCSAEHLASVNAGLTKERVSEIIAETLPTVREASIRAIVNLRTQQAFQHKNRNGGNAPDVGEIAVQAGREFDASPIAAARGDILIGRLGGAIQAELGRNPAMTSNSSHIVPTELTELQKWVWPCPQAATKPALPATPPPAPPSAPSGPGASGGLGATQA